MRKNVFFLFSPGYSGNYLQWIVNVSEQTKTQTTIKDPLLPNGTSHGFVRKPTHTGVFNILNWIIKNKHTTPQTFVVYTNSDTNQWSEHPAHAAYRFLKSYPDGLFVNIYAASDDAMKVAALNGYTKWTTWIYDQAAFNPTHNYKFNWEGGTTGIISLIDRNWLLQNWRNVWPTSTQPFNWEELNYNITCSKNWYKVREEREPNETDSEQFNNFDSFATDCVFDISLQEIYSPDFFKSNKLFSWLDTQGVGNFDWSYAQEYHNTYLQAQENIQWFNDIKLLRNNRQVTPWLMRNSLSQALVLEEVSDWLDHVDNWKFKTTEEILEKLGYTINIIATPEASDVGYQIDA